MLLCWTTFLKKREIENVIKRRYGALRRVSILMGTYQKHCMCTFNKAYRNGLVAKIVSYMP